ncbi:DUF4230 domain-containing protein [Bacillus sp. MCCB 382]|uniref:DUF4230 domain-containing protein n=1 Tax=Bacillus sp. MCCB 382 TaxID=2860197 RepID=UPI001C58AAE1|nr:DUF4230 domain-containing protein [Bacillus sp. MCCB 382]
MNRRKRTERTRTLKRTALTFTLGVAITAGVLTFYQSPASPEATTKLAPVQAKELVDKRAIISALSETPEIVGLTGDISKTVRLQDDKWFGDKTYELTLDGTFKLGVSTKDVDITVKGNTVVVRFPDPHIIAVDLPFDKAAIKKDVGLMRKDLSESELQSLYGQARKQAVADVKVNVKAREKAEDSVEHALEDLIERMPAVESVIFVD